MPEPLPQFVERRQARWDDLEALVDRADRRGGGRLDPEAVRRLGRGYRQVTADLAQARRRYPGDPVTTRLEHLARRARPVLYGHVANRRSVVDYVTTGYWRRVRERPRFLALAAAVLLVPALALGVWTNVDPAGGRQLAQVSPLTAGLADGRGRDPDTQRETDPVVNTDLAAQISTNNARVALVAYAGGLTGGVLTVVSLAFNGLVLGLAAGLSVLAGNGRSFLRLVAPHGILELSLIVTAGAAGLRTGWALLRPGHRTRVEALADDGRAGIEMALGAALLLVPCGLVEG
ncbi:MAG: stage II sporulation protein M, partial [Actinobacteria bacterium]|nr:stage II sporulation protein M [Actinomycetota bacterium]